MMDRLESFDSSDLMEFIAPPKIKIIGVGGAGNNTLSRLYSRQIKGVETFALNTDAMHLDNSQADFKTVLGAKITQGRGAGGENISEVLRNSWRLFLPIFLLHCFWSILQELWKSQEG